MKSLLLMSLSLSVSSCGGWYGDRGGPFFDDCRELSSATVEIQNIRLEQMTANGDHGFLTPGENDAFTFLIDGTATQFTCQIDVRRQTCRYDSATTIAVGAHTLTVQLAGYDDATLAFSIPSQDCNSGELWEIDQQITLTTSNLDAGAQITDGGTTD